MSTSSLISCTEFLFTVYTGIEPARLCKLLALGDDGRLIKRSAGHMVRGVAERVCVTDLNVLSTTLDSLTSAQAVGWGLPDALRNRSNGERVDVVTAASKAGDAAARSVISRTRDDISWPSGAGIMMLDHDGVLGSEWLDVDQLRERLIEACPALADAPMLWRPSASAGITSCDGRVLSPLGRHRLYIPVTCAADIPEAGKRLMQCLWAATRDAPGRYAWCEVGRAGQALERSLIDSTVWQPERLDFAAPPVLCDGLMRLPTVSRIYGDSATCFDLNAIIVDSKTAATCDAARLAARQAVKSDCDVQRERWANERAPAMAERHGTALQQARDTLLRASSEQILTGEFELITCKGARTTVAELLADPGRWDGTRFADPLDPDDDLRVAVVHLGGNLRPSLYTHRHGGMMFALERRPTRVQLGPGRRVAATDESLTALRNEGTLFDHGGGVVQVAGDRIRPVSAEWLTDYLGRVCGYYSRKARKRGGNLVHDEQPEDAPPAIARAILAKEGSRGFRHLTAVITAPTLRLDGSLLDTPGYDEASGLLLVGSDRFTSRVPEFPTVVEAIAALRELWDVVAHFPLVDDVDRGVLLAAVLTATLRGSLPTAPGFGFDAPAAGTGKTLLARCLGIIATGADPTILAPAEGDDETRKRLASALQEGERVILLDNVDDRLGNAALNTFLTAPTFGDRRLGTNEIRRWTNRALFLVTGNNLRLTSDTCRRVLVARLDARMEAPYKRHFQFDPAQRVNSQRMKLVHAALTIIRAYVAAGRPHVAEGRTASFEDWDGLVRQPVCWLAQQIQRMAPPAVPSFGDPIAAVTRAYDQDPQTTQQRDLLRVWFATYQSAPQAVAAVVRDAASHAELEAVLQAVAERDGKISNKALGRCLERYSGRPVGGLCLERSTVRTGLQQWVVREAMVA